MDQVPARGPCERARLLFAQGDGPEEALLCLDSGSGWHLQPSAPPPAQAPDLDLAMREPRRGFGARLVQLLTGLGGRRERRGKISKEARLPHR